MQGIYFLAEKEKFVDTFGDDMLARFVQKGIPTAILGMVTVFVVLALVWGFLEIFRYVFYTIPEKKKKSAVAAPVTEIVEETAESVSDDGEIVAAIIAAITAFRAEESASSGKQNGGFKVVSFRKR